MTFNNDCFVITNNDEVVLKTPFKRKQNRQETGLKATERFLKTLFQICDKSIAKRYLLQRPTQLKKVRLN